MLRQKTESLAFWCIKNGCSSFYGFYFTCDLWQNYIEDNMKRKTFVCGRVIHFVISHRPTRRQESWSVCANVSSVRTILLINLLPISVQSVFVVPLRWNLTALTREYSHFTVNGRHEGTLPCFPVPPHVVQAAALDPQPSSLTRQSCPDWLGLLLLMTPTEKQIQNAMYSCTHWTTFARRLETTFKWDAGIYCSMSAGSDNLKYKP